MTTSLTSSFDLSSLLRFFKFSVKFSFLNISLYASLNCIITLLGIFFLLSPIKFKPWRTLLFPWAIPYGIAHGNRSVLHGLNLIGLRRKNIPNQEIMTLSSAYKEIFKNENLTENLNNLNQDYKKNELVKEVINFLEKDKKRPICTPFSK